MAREKLDEAIFEETIDELADRETLDAGLYRNKVVSTTANLLRKLQECGTSAPRLTTVNRSPTFKCNVPQLELLKFDGNCRSWQPFWTHFSAAVHKSDKLSMADKFNYFSNPPTETAASAISGLQATDHSYKDAMEILKEHCGDDHISVKDHRRGFLDLKPVTSSSIMRELKQLYGRYEVHIRSLNAL
ncbi:uncharacterized protein LOC144143182 [Haemaphysalis longicornis]